MCVCVCVCVWIGNFPLLTFRYGCELALHFNGVLNPADDLTPVGKMALIESITPSIKKEKLMLNSIRTHPHLLFLALHFNGVFESS